MRTSGHRVLITSGAGGIGLALGLCGMVHAGQTTVTLEGYTTGAFRWKDIGGNLYGTAYQSSYSYTQALVQVTCSTTGTVLYGAVTATNLKPNFAYQVKFSGFPESYPEANEALGFSGRWWKEEWDGSKWANGGNLNSRGDGSFPNPNDVWYIDHRDDPYTSSPPSPTGLKYRFTGYRPFDYFITDSNGNATVEIEMRDTYHVLFGDWQGAPGESDGPMKRHSFDPDPAAHPAYDTNYPATTNGVYGEWERLPKGKICIAPGDYSLDFVLTEESFHESGLGGAWAAAVHGLVQFAIVRPVISATAGPAHGGTMSLAGEVEIDCRGSTNVLIQPADYWEIEDVVVDEISYGATGSWAFVEVVTNHSITARFNPLLASNAVPKWWLAQQDQDWTNDFDAAAINDADGDGLLTWEEYLAGTDPTDRDSVFRIESASVINGTNRIVWLSPVSDPDLPPFGVMRSTNLVEWTLVDIAADRSTDGTNMWWDYDPLPPTVPAHYRVIATDRAE